MPHRAPTPPRTFTLPDLEGHCPYALALNPHTSPVARASEAWLLAHAHASGPKRARAAIRRLRAGELAGACYPGACAQALRDGADFLGFLFTLDDWSDEFRGGRDAGGLAACVMGALADPNGCRSTKAAGRLAQSIGARLHENAGPRCGRRFMETMDLFFRAVAQQAKDRTRGDVPSFEEYVALRWDTSGCKPCFALIEYAAGIDLPDEVASHPTVRALEEAANSYISWSNDIFSYNVEQARGDSHNMLVVVMQRHAISLQEAVDFVGGLCDASIARFEHDRRTLPSWGPEVDRAVAAYVQGLQDWMVGTLHWSFESGRYFGDEGGHIKKSRISGTHCSSHSSQLISRLSLFLTNMK
ncbi:terpenoid synthase [Epithele typhae]|uniref:terpenoid synthase n=1 Tax=Epithele typhae TaxID=378194 RepID=UPI002007C0F7|nr:terpenoid synthase [Epithele typhae]KAH9945422.1 terpenoid synthase [Epithele typhae]